MICRHLWGWLIQSNHALQRIGSISMSRLTYLYSAVVVVFVVVNLDTIVPYIYKKYMDNRYHIVFVPVHFFFWSWKCPFSPWSWYCIIGCRSIAHQQVDSTLIPIVFPRSLVDERSIAYTNLVDPWLAVLMYEAFRWCELVSWFAGRLN